MSLYRRLIVAVAVMGLTTSVFAADENDTTTTTTTTETTAVQSAPVEAPDATTTTTTTTITTEKVDINKATTKELMKVKGLSAVKARAIVSYRKKHGDFKSVDELKEVKGFKKMKNEKMEEVMSQLTVN
jgi:competence protein ComEA